jgi:hypothetical protein
MGVGRCVVLRLPNSAFAREVESKLGRTSIWQLLAPAGGGGAAAAGKQASNRQPREIRSSKSLMGTHAAASIQYFAEFAYK